MFEFLLFPIVELLFEAVVWAIDRILRLFGRAISGVFRLSYVFDAILAITSGVLGYVWGEHIAATTPDQPPIAMFSLTLFGLAALAMAAAKASKPNQRPTRRHHYQVKPVSYFAFTSARWARLGLFNLIGAAGVALGFSGLLGL